MALLFRLPLMLIELLLRRLLGRDGDDDAWAPASTAPPESPAARATPQPPPPHAQPERGATPGPPPPTAEEAIERRFAREAAAPPPPPEPAAPPTPLRAVGDDGHVDTEVTVVESFGPADDVGGTITVDEPWDGYDGQAAAAIVQRVRGADEATKAVVRLYEQQHKGRATVLRATG